MEKRMATTRREFLESTSVACLAPLVSSSLLHSKSAAQVSNPAPIKMEQTPVLDIGYEEHGPEDGFPIILLHGFPYDVRSFDGVYSPLAAAGYRQCASANIILEKSPVSPSLPSQRPMVLTPKSHMGLLRTGFY